MFWCKVTHSEGYIFSLLHYHNHYPSQWKIQGCIFGIEDLYDKRKQGLQQCGHVLSPRMGRQNRENGQNPTEDFFCQHGQTYSKMYKEKIKEPEHQT